MKNKISYLLILSKFFIFLIVSLYIIYRSEIIYSGQYRSYYFYEFFLSIFLCLFFLYSSFKNSSFKINSLLVFYSSIFCLFIIELYLTFFLKPIRIEDIHKKFSKNEKFELDLRTRKEFYLDEKKINPEIVVSVSSDNFISKDKKFIPLSAISNKETISCNESGQFKKYFSDRYGFNNPDKMWDKQEIDFLILGDSFAHGDCVFEENNFAGNLRKISKKNTINLGYGGNGPIRSLAALQEYVDLINVKNILWMYYEGNDAQNYIYEKKNQILNNYILDENFKQNLYLKQKKINELIYTTIDQELDARKVNFNVKNLIKLNATRRLFLSKTTQEINLNEHFFKIFERAAFIANKKKANFYVFMIPSAEKLYGNKDYSQSEKIKKELEKRNIEVIDLFKELISDSSEEFYPFNYKSAHFSKNGYYQVANFIYNLIESN